MSGFGCGGVSDIVAPKSTEFIAGVGCPAAGGWWRIWWAVRKFQVRLGGGLVALEELGHGPGDPILAGLIAGGLGGFGIQLGPLGRQSRGDIEVGAEEFFAEHGQHLRMDEVAVLEADLDLGRVDIDIEFLRRHFEEQKHHGVLVGLDEAAVGLAEGVADEFVADEAAVEEGVLEVARARAGGRADHRRDGHAAFGAAGLDEVVGHRLAEQAGDSLPQALPAGEVIDRAAVVFEGQVDVAVGQGDPREVFGDVADLGVGGAKELAAGGELVEQVADFDGGSDIAGARPDGFGAAAVDVQPRRRRSNRQGG